MELPYTEEQLYDVAHRGGVKNPEESYDDVVCVSLVIADTWKYGTIERCVFKWKGWFYEAEFTISFSYKYGHLNPRSECGKTFQAKQVRRVVETREVTSYVAM